MLTPRGQTIALDLRVRDIERRIERLLSQQRTGDALSQPLFSRASPPKPSGLSVTRGGGSLEISFDPVAIPNLRRYRVQISTASNFAAAEEIETRETSLSFRPGTGVGETTYFVRVQTEASDGSVSGFSSAVSRAPGTVNTTDIQNASITTAKIEDLAAQTGKFANLSTESLKIKDNAATIPSGAFTASFINVSGETDVQELTVTLDDDDAPLLIYGAHEPVNVIISRTYTTRLYQDTTAILTSADVIVSANANDSFRYVAIITPGSGTFTFKMTVEAGNGAIVANRTLLTWMLKK